MQCARLLEKVERTTDSTLFTPEARRRLCQHGVVEDRTVLSTVGGATVVVKRWNIAHGEGLWFASVVVSDRRVDAGELTNQS